MNNTKVKEIIKFSFYKSIQNKWFIIFNILTLFSMIVIINWGYISSIFEPSYENKVFEIAFLDNSNLIYDEFYSSFSGDNAFKVMRVYENNYTPENIPDDFAVVEIVPDEVECFKTSIISKEGIDAKIYNSIKDRLFDLRNNLLAEKYKVSREELDIFQSKLSVNRVMLSVNAEDSNTKEIIKLFSSALTYLLTIFIFSKMSNEIASEKQSKAVEYILTTVSAKEYMFAKIFSSISILLIQGLFIFAYYYIAVCMMNIINISTTDLSLNTSLLMNGLNQDVIYYIFTLILYNVLNLVLLCIVQATLSAKTSSTTEAGNTVSILVFIMMLAYVATVYVINPYTKANLFIYIISCLPLLSAYFVPGMMVVGQATWVQIVISLLLLIVSIPILFNFCSKIFKNGILDYTKVKKKKVKEIDINEEQKRFLEKRRMKNFGFVIGLSIIIYIGTQTIFSILGSFTLPTLLGDVLSESELTLILQMVLQIVSLGLAYLFVNAYIDKENAKLEPRCDISVKQKVKIIFIAILMIFGLQFLLSLVIYPAIGLDYSTIDMFYIDSNSSLLAKIILILAIAVTPAIFEELFFRKAIIDFSSRYGKKFALIFSALFFGVLHLNLSQGLFAFIVGIIFGAIYLYTKDIKFTMIIHFINNGFAALELILPEMGVLIISGILLVCLIIGFTLLIIMFSKRYTREKIKELCDVKVSTVTSWKYIFTDFTFDISLILVLLMGILTESILR